MKNQFTEAENRILTETYRRLNYLAKGDLNSRLLLLEFPSNVKTLKAKGILKPSSSETPKIINWYNLTEKGKELFKTRIVKISSKRNLQLFEGNEVMNFNKNETIQNY